MAKPSAVCAFLLFHIEITTTVQTAGTPSCHTHSFTIHTLLSLPYPTPHSPPYPFFSLAAALPGSVEKKCFFSKKKGSDPFLKWFPMFFLVFLVFFFCLEISFFLIFFYLLWIIFLKFFEIFFDHFVRIKRGQWHTVRSFSRLFF